MKTIAALCILACTAALAAEPKPVAPPPDSAVASTPLVPLTTDHEDALTRYTFWLMVFTGVLAVSTIGLWITALLGGKDVRASITQARRSATAMHKVAGHFEQSVNTAIESSNTLKERTAMQMRAYLSVVINNGTYQERDKGYRFDVRPQVVNNGHTPAHKFTYWATAAVFDHPLPDEAELPTGKDIKSSFVLGPQQSIEISAGLNDYLPDIEAARVLRADGRALYIWGQLFYDDVFGAQHRTNFCHCIFWVPTPNGTIVRGVYAKRHNEAT